MERIIQRINDSDWEAAAEALLDVMETHEFNDTIAVLAATINEQLGDDDMMFSFIEKGLLYNYKNYELYLLLGNYYAARNVNQAYLCYENALYFCEGTEDYEYISEFLDNFKKENSVNVPPYSFVILSYNTLELTKKCIESIRRNCNKGSYEIIIVDNASSDGSLEYLRQQEDIALIANDVNVGFPAGCNQGIAESAQRNDIMLLNSDTIVMPNSMFTLRMGLYASEDNGTAGSVTNFSGNSQIIGESFESIADYENYSIKNNIMREHIYEYKAWLVGFALLLKRSALDCAGEGLDERFSPGNFEDDDLCLRMLSMGYHNVLCWNSFIYHYGHKSFSVMPRQQVLDIMQVNQEKFKNKWGFDVRYYSNSRNEVADLIDEKPDTAFSVLDIGCGIGALMGRIKYKYPNSDVHGIEIVEKVARLGAVNFDIVCGNIEELSLPYEEGFFDYIVMADVVEHLRNPEMVLDKVKRYLKPEGRIIMSITNMMNAENIYKLLHGFFTYEEFGIRDNTHLRFFTYIEILNMLERMGFKPEEIRKSSCDGFTTNDYKDFFDKLLAIDGIAERKYFDAYQYLLRAKKISI